MYQSRITREPCKCLSKGSPIGCWCHCTMGRAVRSGLYHIFIENTNSPQKMIAEDKIWHVYVDIVEVWTHQMPLQPTWCNDFLTYLSESCHLANMYGIHTCIMLGWFGDVKKQDICDIASQNTTLNRGSNSNGFLGVDTFSQSCLNMTSRFHQPEAYKSHQTMHMACMLHLMPEAFMSSIHAWF